MSTTHRSQKRFSLPNLLNSMKYLTSFAVIIWSSIFLLTGCGLFSSKVSGRYVCRSYAARDMDEEGTPLNFKPDDVVEIEMAWTSSSGEHVNAGTQRGRYVVEGDRVIINGTLIYSNVPLFIRGNELVVNDGNGTPSVRCKKS